MSKSETTVWRATKSRWGSSSESAIEIHGDVQLLSHEIEDTDHPCLAGSGQSPQNRSPDEHRAGADGKGLQHVGSSPNAAVDEDLERRVSRPLHNLDHPGKDLHGGRRGVQLPAASIRDDDAGGAAVRSPQDRLCQQIAARVAVPEVVLEIERAGRAVDQHEPPAQRVAIPVEELEA